jgi:hypothetical protein
LGEAEVVTNGGSINVTLTAAGINGLVIADAVRIVPVSERVLYREGEFAVVDNGDPGFGGDTNGVSTWGQTVGVTSFDGEYAYLKGDNSGDKATWTLTVVPGTYQVGLSWQWASYNRATDASFTINGGAPITVNQTLAPSANQLGAGAGVMYANGTAFQVLTNTVVVPAGGSTLEVSVADNANSYVVLDAVMARLVSLPSPLEAEGGPAPQSAAAESVTNEQLSPLLAEAITRWSASGLDDFQIESLESAEVKIADLPDAALGVASEAGQTIWIDVDAAGYGWFVDGTPALDEEFPLALSAGGELEAVDGGAAEGMDLLTVLSHELGHLLGLEDLDPHAHDHDLMAATLATGIRRLPVVESGELATGPEAASERQLSDDPGSHTGGPGLAATAAVEVSEHQARDALFAQLGAAVSFRSQRFADEEVEDSREDLDSREELGWLLLGVG